MSEGLISLDDYLAKHYKKEKDWIDSFGYLLPQPELEKFARFRHLITDSVSEFDPYTILPEREHKVFNYLLGRPKPSSNMNDTELLESLNSAREKPWDVFGVLKMDGGETELRSTDCQLDIKLFGKEKGNYLHFEPFNIDDPKELKEKFPNVPVTHPMYLWLKGTEKMIFAIENRIIKLATPGIITAKTNTTHGAFLTHFGFEKINDEYTVVYKKLKDKFEEMVNKDPVTKRIIKSGETIYKDALTKVPKYLEKLSNLGVTADFWTWYYSQK